MSKPSNLKKFEKVTGKAFEKLYQSFPMPCALDLHEDFGVPRDPHAEEGFETCSPLILDEFTFIDCTLRWLAQTDYIALGQFKYPYFLNVQLTAKGLSVLCSHVEHIDKRKSIGQKITEIFSRGVEDGLSELVWAAIAKGVGMTPLLFRGL